MKTDTSSIERLKDDSRNLSLRGFWMIYGVVLLWRFLLLLTTAQPIPANDAFPIDGAVVHWLLHGHYINPCLSQAVPISSHIVFSIYPPGYQIPLLLWMSVFGTSALSSMWMHFIMFAVAGFLVARILQSIFPAGPQYALAGLLFFGITWGDRTEDFAHIFGLAALLLVVLKMNKKIDGYAVEIGLILLLFITLYTTPIPGALYFGTCFLVQLAAWGIARRRISLVAYAMVVLLFVAVTLFIVKMYPILWQGFMENAALQKPENTTWIHKIHLPTVKALVKLLRKAPVFLVVIACLPFMLKKRAWKFEVPENEVAWLSLTIGILCMGTILIVTILVLLSPNYMGYLQYLQIILGAGLLAYGARFFSGVQRILNGGIVGCAFLLSVRAVGMTTWGVACAHDVSYLKSREILRAELQPYVTSDRPVAISSAFLYAAAEFGVKNPIDSDWVWDWHIDGSTEAGLRGMVKMHPAKLVLTQFDYYRGMLTPIIEELQKHPELVTVHVRDSATFKTPDSISSFQKVVQHISWAPVIVELEWK